MKPLLSFPRVLALPLIASLIGLAIACRPLAEPSASPTGKISPTTVASSTAPPAVSPLPAASTPVSASPSPSASAATPSISSTIPAAAPSSTAAPASAISVGVDLIPSPPPRDLVDLSHRLKPGASLTPPAATPPPADLTVGSTREFWIADEQAKNYFQMMAQLALKTSHGSWYLQQGVDLPRADLQSAASFFENQTYPTEQRLFGGDWMSDARGGVHLTVLIGNIPDVGGYFSSADEYPRQVNPYSNQGEIIYINVGAVRPGSPGFNSTVAHEFEHLIQFHVHRNQNSWIDEGSAELAAQAVTGAVSSGVRSFEQQPQTQLNAWASEPRAAVPHYGAAYLFMRYVSEQFGGFQSIGKVVAEPGRGMAAFRGFFDTLKPPRTFDDVFADWVAANELDDPSLDQGRFGYHGLKLNLRTQPGPAMGETTTSPVTQFGARYFMIAPARDARLQFQGDPRVRLIGGDPHEARYEWWSNKGDSIDTRLTRPVDLRPVSRATLKFWAWYDIEDGYDYAYVEASTDDGATWTTLPATTTTTANPNGQNYGNGLTGTSGGKPATWVPETADLSADAGKQILLRFEYVTDDSFNADGLAIDDVEIPEIGFVDRADGDDGWTSEGFARIDNRVAQPYLVEVIATNGADRVHRIAVGADGHGETVVSGGAPSIVAVAGLAPITTHDSSAELTLTPK